MGRKYSLNQLIGKKGEDLVINYLKKKGFALIDKNIEVHNVGEIDIIAIKGKILIFVEVRSKNSQEHGHPFETINKNKQRRIINTAVVYMAKNRHLTKNIEEIRFDAASILWNREMVGTIEYIEGAFEGNNGWV